MISLSNSGNLRQTMHLDALLGHLGASSGLYSRETFLNICSTLVRMLRQGNTPAVVMLRTLEEPLFEAITSTLEGQDNLTCITVKDACLEQHADAFEGRGFLIILSAEFSATIYWSTKTQDRFRNYEGGWCFHPGDTKRIAEYVAECMSDETQKIVESCSIERCDRHHNEKTTWLITQLVDQLEGRNRELTTTLDEVKHLNMTLLDQERLAAVGQLCSVIAHEIRNPLGLIDLYAKLIEHQVEKLETPTDKAPLEQNLELIRTATQDLEKILSELTSYSRPLQLEKEETDLCAVIREVVAMYTPKYDELHVRLRCQVPETPIMLMLDRARVRQALINLVKNALEVSKPGTQVDVVLAPRQNDSQLYTKVYDQGPGVDEKYRQKLFTPYFSTKGNGTGLGLAHSKKILQAHGGSVELLRSDSSGSAFALILPTGE